MAEPNVVVIREPPVYDPDSVKRARAMLERAYLRALVKVLHQQSDAKDK